MRTAPQCAITTNRTPLTPATATTTTAHQQSETNDDNNIQQQQQQQQQQQPQTSEYGVSYIGGDPCGSKYNDDPFDTQVTKPGMPDDMKARIKALAHKKTVAVEKAAAISATNNAEDTNLGDF